MPLVARAETNGLLPHQVLFREHPSLSVDQWNRPSWRAKMNAHPATFNAEPRIHRRSACAWLQMRSINSRSPSAIDLCCLTSTAALRESIHQGSRSNRDSGADNCWHTVFTVGEGNADHAH